MYTNINADWTPSYLGKQGVEAKLIFPVMTGESAPKKLPFWVTFAAGG